jgi:hypothetical protein
MRDFGLSHKIRELLIEAPRSRSQLIAELTFFVPPERAVRRSRGKRALANAQRRRVGAPTTGVKRPQTIAKERKSGARSIIGDQIRQSLVREDAIELDDGLLHITAIGAARYFCTRCRQAPRRMPSAKYCEPCAVLVLKEQDAYWNKIRKRRRQA